MTVLYPPPPPNNQRRPFLTPIPDLPGEFLLVLDNTALGYIKRCHKAAQAYLILGREERPRSAALAYGGAMHAGLEVFHKAQWWVQAHKDKLVDSTGSSTMALEEAMAKYNNIAQNQAILSYFTQNPVPSGDYRNSTSALAVLAAYRKRCNTTLYPDYEWEIQADEKGLIIERAFEIPMGVVDVDIIANMPWLTPDQLWCHIGGRDHVRNVPVSRIHLAWSGRIDLIAKVNSHIHIVDHKTSSIDADSFLKGFQFSSQTIGYVWAARHLFPDFDISRFCLNCIQFKKPSGDCGPTDRGPRGGAPALSFYRSYFTYSDERIQRWLGDTQLLIEDFLHSVSRNHFPLNDRSCFDKFGMCPYFDACSIDNEESGDRYLQSESYKEVTWNPTT